MTLLIAILAAVIVGGIIFTVYQFNRPYMVFPNSPMVETDRSRNQVNNDLARDDLTAAERTRVEGESNWLDYVEKMSR
jgi:hypothetical protein